MFSKALCTLIVLLFAWTPAVAQKFLEDDPIKVDRDNLIDASQTKPRKLSDYYDFLENTFDKPGDRSPKSAINANTLGEVPDSSWFQNRHGQQRMTADELALGPNTGTGPALDGQWIVTDGKSEGVTPGFRIRDSRGDSYFIKFDPVSNPEMATSAEVISTKFFYAMGFNVPENYLVFFKREDLLVDQSAEISEGLGPKRKMDENDLDRLLARVPMTMDKRYRAIASKLLGGRPIGPFIYFGTAPDDPNDVIPHEHRRELRGLQVFSAWLNHDDSRAVNTQDTIVTENGMTFVRHYLIDFGSTLGSGSIMAQKPRAGWEYLWEPRPVFRRIVTLGLWDSHWIRVHYPDIPSVGRFESKAFSPQDWKPEYPNAAFVNALPEDSYWAAKIVMAFTDDDIRTVVRTGGLTDPEAEKYVVNTLIERRDKIGRYYFNRVLSLDNFALEGNSVRFVHRAAQYAFAQQPAKVALSWFRFDNAKEVRTLIGKDVTAEGSTFSIPSELVKDSGPYFGVEIREITGPDRKAGPTVSLYIRRMPSVEIVGIERTARVD
jgi:hypothetical protein